MYQFTDGKISPINEAKLRKFVKTVVQTWHHHGIRVSRSSTKRKRPLAESCGTLQLIAHEEQFNQKM